LEFSTCLKTPPFSLTVKVELFCAYFIPTTILFSPFFKHFEVVSFLFSVACSSFSSFLSERYPRALHPVSPSLVEDSCLLPHLTLLLYQSSLLLDLCHLPLFPPLTSFPFFREGAALDFSSSPLVQRELGHWVRSYRDLFTIPIPCVM